MSESSSDILQEVINKLEDFNAQFQFNKGFYRHLFSDGAEAIGVEHDLVNFKSFEYYLLNQRIMFESLAQESENLIDKLRDIEKSLEVEEHLIVKGE